MDTSKDRLPTRRGRERELTPSSGSAEIQELPDDMGDTNSQNLAIFSNIVDGMGDDLCIHPVKVCNILDIGLGLGI